MMKSYLTLNQVSQLVECLVKDHYQKQQQNKIMEICMKQGCTQPSILCPLCKNLHNDHREKLVSIAEIEKEFSNSLQDNESKKLLLLINEFEQFERKQLEVMVKNMKSLINPFNILETIMMKNKQQSYHQLKDQVSELIKLIEFDNFKVKFKQLNLQEIKVQINYLANQYLLNIQNFVQQDGILGQPIQQQSNNVLIIQKQQQQQQNNIVSEVQGPKIKDFHFLQENGGKKILCVAPNCVKFDQFKGQQQQNNYDIEKSIVPLKQLIQEIQNLLKNIQNIIQQVEQGKLQNNNINHLENQILNIQKYGFNQIDDQSLNNLINIPEKQQDLQIYNQLEEQASLIIQNAQKIKEWRFQQVENKSQSLTQSQKIKDAKYQLQQIDDTGDKEIYTGAISNDLKYIVSGGDDNLLKIWDYQSNQLIKSIELNKLVRSCKFTEDSKLLYAGSVKYLYQFDVQNQFEKLCKYLIHNNYINCIYCITNTLILTSSYQSIIKTDVYKEQQLLKIQAHNNYINGLDFNKSLNIIGSVSCDKSIKLWNGNDGSLIIKKQNAHNNDNSIRQVIFIINNNQLISLCSGSILIIWNINYETKQLEQLQLIKDSGYNISLVLQQQYIIATGIKFIKVYSIKGEFVRQLDHGVDNFIYLLLMVVLIQSNLIP